MAQVALGAAAAGSAAGTATAAVLEHEVLRLFAELTPLGDGPTDAVPAIRAELMFEAALDAVILFSDLAFLLRNLLDPLGDDYRVRTRLVGAARAGAEDENQENRD